MTQRAARLSVPAVIAVSMTPAPLYAQSSSGAINGALNRTSDLLRSNPVAQHPSPSVDRKGAAGQRTRAAAKTEASSTTPSRPTNALPRDRGSLVAADPSTYRLKSGVVLQVTGDLVPDHATSMLKALHRGGAVAQLCRFPGPLKLPLYLVRSSPR